MQLNTYDERNKLINILNKFIKKKHSKHSNLEFGKYEHSYQRENESETESEQFLILEELGSKEQVFEVVFLNNGQYLDTGKIILQKENGFIHFFKQENVEEIDFNGINIYYSEKNPQIVTINMSNYRNYTLSLTPSELALKLYNELSFRQKEINIK